MKRLVESLDGKIELFFLPPYSPELNPEGHVWIDLKNNGIGRMAISGPGDMKLKIVGYLKRMQRTPELIRSFVSLRRACVTRFEAI